ncbi:hypothetical protein V3C99_004961 [Haemonchus contortus]
MSKVVQEVPSVPCGHRPSRQRGQRQRGRNLTASDLPSCFLNIATINVRGLTSDSAVDQLISELDKCAVDVACVQETLRFEAGTWKWHTGHEVMLGAGSKNGKVGGVGFIIAPHLATKITHCEIFSERIAMLVLELDGGSTIKLLSVYVPTGAYGDDAVEEFYDELENAVNGPPKGTYVICAGDYNAHLGRGESGENFVGPHGTPGRNSRGETLVQFCERTRLSVANTYFQKRLGRRWTYHTPNRQMFHEIDFILTNCLRLFHNVGVIGESRFNIGSDHRLVRATIAIKPKEERKRLAAYHSKRIRYELNEETLKTLAATVDFTGGSGNVHTRYEKVTSAIRTVVKDASQRVRSKPRERLSEVTLQMLATRKEVGKTMTPVARTVLNKAIRVRVKNDYREYAARRAREAAEKATSIKRTFISTRLKTTTPECLTKADGTVLRNRKVIEEEIRTFFQDLFSSKVHVEAYSEPPEGENDNKEEWRVLESEVMQAIRQMKSGKAPGPDQIRPEHSKCLKEVLARPLADLFTEMLDSGIVPKDWLSSHTILIHKKGARDILPDYRPIALLSTMLKVFSRVILNRIRHILNMNTGKEQAGFREGFSTIDQIHVITQLAERCREYRIPLCYLFIDFKKAFDTVEHQAVLNALTAFGVPRRYVEMIRKCNTSCFTDVNLYGNPTRIQIRRGVRQGEVISPMLFSAALEIVMQNAQMPCGINIDGERLQYLMFADDIVLIGSEPSALENSLRILRIAASSIGLEIHPGKTKWMKNSYASDYCLRMDDSVIEEVSSYVYLGQAVTMDNDLTVEISRRRRAGWVAFNKYRDVLTDKRIDAQVRARVFNTHVLPALVYGSETWNTILNEERRLASTQRAMERVMCGITLMHKIPAHEIRRRTGVKDVIENIYDSKKRWAGHVARLNDNRWTSRVTNWYPRGVKRPRGRPLARWSDPFRKLFGQRWQQVARNRNEWHRCVLQGWRNHP